jgi:signal transduction histidine kinase
LYRISKAYLKPVTRLVKRAEQYTEKEDKPFLVRKEDNELTQLSQALNNMLLRISKDRKQLQSHIESLKQVNAELRQAQNDIVRAEKYATVGRLASGVAHEIGNPIGIVKGYIELLEQGGADDNEKKDYLIRAKDEINRISSIIRQLLDFSRSSKASLAAVDLHKIITDVADLVQHQPMMLHIHMTLSLSAPVDRVYADPDQLCQVFLNLIINASDAILSLNTDIEGEIYIKSENLSFGKNHQNNSDPYWIKILIIDNGPGIDKKHIEHIFDPFFTTKEPGKGTGLGLWVCYMIVNDAGGKIRAISQPGNKTALEVSLPIYTG